MMVGRAVASAVAVFDLRLVVLTGVRARRRSASRCSTPPGASSTSAAAWPTCAPAPTAASTACASSSRALGREAPLVGAAALARWSRVAA